MLLQLTALDSSSSSSHVPTQELNVASGPDSGSPVQQQQQQQSMLPATQLSPAYPQSRGQQVNVFSGASQILDQTLQHLGLRRLQDLSESERMSLIPTCMHALEVYTSHLHKEEDHRYMCSMSGVRRTTEAMLCRLVWEAQLD